MIIYEDTLDISYLIPIYELLCNDDIELLFVDSVNMQEINLNTRNINKSTDVLSFPHDNSFINSHFAGSIVINIDLAKEKSLEFKHSFEDEVCLLFIHGLLHLLGYDHEVDDGQMRQKECELIKKFNLPNSLIVRTEL
ncbi:rRNA maturation RNase YbeY [Campylobacter canadensis]|uniref:Endoribonuclease YbeY n=1 Tax=Campylobacter canadensis TaxID=449520 RepID=A0ABS7WP22_9BACT|nr:rRNA maturation RNase YbeY [Campylobacter canadensis]MBZ7986521.1 rRNA maturation RNase YbeY [Campylobacter canadensis]MBZ7994074.1 rRNA maturation RNase YbeY [Campylobacter canadensis]MBZ7995923.1 rRNA maturation RNase YbeY [Campylobacter canadensis]MBZ7997557.1 rRNA maturation RNase YbeY [Campylobacter canadensis]MBZ7999405.1 rRNA maturation RNase YbeY [Campylobacter canadensis]